MDGWLSDYQIAHGFSNPGQLKVLAKQLSDLNSDYLQISHPLEEQLSNIYQQDTVEEWLEENLLERIRRNEKHIIRVKNLLKESSWKSRPFKKIDINKEIDLLMNINEGLKEKPASSKLSQLKNESITIGKQEQKDLAESITLINKQIEQEDEYIRALKTNQAVNEDAIVPKIPRLPQLLHLPEQSQTLNNFSKFSSNSLKLPTVPIADKLSKSPELEKSPTSLLNSTLLKKLQTSIVKSENTLVKTDKLIKSALSSRAILPPSSPDAQVNIESKEQITSNFKTSSDDPRDEDYDDDEDKGLELRPETFKTQKKSFRDIQKDNELIDDQMDRYEKSILQSSN